MRQVDYLSVAASSWSTVDVASQEGMIDFKKEPSTLMDRAPKELLRHSNSALEQSVY